MYWRKGLLPEQIFVVRTSDVERTAVRVVHGYLGDPQPSLLWSVFIPCLALFGSPIFITSGQTSGPTSGPSGLGPLGWIADRDRDLCLCPPCFGLFPKILQ